jgi:hypothetical protein
MQCANCKYNNIIVQYELPTDSETHLCSYCGDPPTKHLIAQTAESEKDDKEPEGEIQ